MRTNPRFSIGERVQGATATSLLLSEGRVRAIDIAESEGGRRWSYSVEPPAGGGGWLVGLDELELARVETPATRAQAHRELLEHHAGEARRWADAADREETDGEELHRVRGQRYAAISQAHGLAAIASTLAESAVAIEQ